MKSPLFSKRVDAIEPPKIKVDFAEVRKPGVISLSIGEPDFETPWAIKQAGIEAIQNGNTFYADDMGLPKLREEIALYVKKRYGLDYDPQDEILVSVGASEAIDLAFRAFLNEEDEVIIPQPAYNSYGPVVTLLGGKVVGVSLYEKNAFRLKAEDLEKVITPRSKLLILNYPHNPTGAIMEKEDLLPIAEIAKKHDLYVVSDEIYSELTYGKKHFSIAALPGMKERTIYISGFSKAFAMTGWRLGYICAPKEAIAHMRKIHQYCTLASPTISQYAAVEALHNGQDETDKMKRAYDERRHYLIKALKETKLDCFAPEGAFYVFPCIKETGLSSDEFVDKLFKEEKLLFISGTGFGPLGEGYVRISYAYSLDKIKEGMARLSHFLSRHSR